MTNDQVSRLREEMSDKLEGMIEKKKEIEKRRTQCVHAVKHRPLITSIANWRLQILETSATMKLTHVRSTNCKAEHRSFISGSVI